MDIDKLKKYRFVYHALFWVTFILVFSLFFTIQFPFGKSFAIITLTAVSYMPAVYFNVFYLIPKVLIKRRQFNRYVIYVFLTVLISVPLVALVSYYNFNDTENFTENYSIPLLMVGSFINTFFMVVLVSGLKFAKDYFIQQQKTMELQQQNLVSELRFLKSQINPHFLFNTLNNIYSLTLKNDETAPEAVLKLSELMRYILYECNELQVPLSKEIQCVNNYIDLERLRQGSGSNIRIQVEGQNEGYTIAPLLFIPFLENSFKHGLNRQIQDSWVDINIRIEDQSLHLIISNSNEANPPRNSQSGGIGLKNVKRRLELLYPDSHHLEIKDTGSAYEVNLTLQLKQPGLAGAIKQPGTARESKSSYAIKFN